MRHYCLLSSPTCHSSLFPLQVFADAYKATITKEIGTKGETAEVEEDVYESHNLAQYIAGNKTDPSLKTQGVRINGDAKFVEMRDITQATPYKVDIDGTEHHVSIEKVTILKGKNNSLVLGVKGGYYLAAIYKADARSDTSPAIAQALAISFYWAVGPDAA